MSFELRAGNQLHARPLADNFVIVKVDNFSRPNRRDHMKSSSKNVIPIHSYRIFSRDEAEEILPIIRRITDRAADEVFSLQTQLKWVPKEEPTYARLQAEIDATVDRWASKASRLGCTPSGIWAVDFDAHDGKFSWSYGDHLLCEHRFSNDDLNILSSAT